MTPGGGRAKVVAWRITQACRPLVRRCPDPAGRRDGATRSPRSLAAAFGDRGNRGPRGAVVRVGAGEGPARAVLCGGGAEHVGELTRLHLRRVRPGGHHHLGQAARGVLGTGAERAGLRLQHLGDGLPQVVEGVVIVLVLYRAAGRRVILVDSDVLIEHLRGSTAARDWLVHARQSSGPLATAS